MARRGARADGQWYGGAHPRYFGRHAAYHAALPGGSGHLRLPRPSQRSRRVRRQKAGGSKVSRLEYEGWRQYSVNCARCHGQDVLPNPVAANLLVSVKSGRPDRHTGEVPRGSDQGQAGAGNAGVRTPAHG